MFLFLSEYGTSVIGLGIFIWDVYYLSIICSLHKFVRKFPALIDSREGTFRDSFESLINIFMKRIVPFSRNPIYPQIVTLQ